MKMLRKNVWISLVLLCLIFSASSSAMDANATIAHLQDALKALNSNELDAAQAHMKAARQTAKDIVGGSLEVKAQRASSLITTARRQIQSGDIAAAKASLQESLDLFKALHNTGAGGRGGLN
jgi:cellobiose-specific phosphotransferase system component IIA